MKRILYGLLLLVVTVSLSAQIIATTEDGRKVVLKKDGTWEYMQETTAITPAKKSKGKKAKASEPQAPVVKTVTMDDYKCGEIIGTKLNKQTQQENRALVQELLISEPGDETRFSMVLGVNNSKTYTWDLTLSGISGCATQTPMITLRFKDGSETKLPVGNDFVCDKQVSLFLSKGLGHKGELKALRAKPLQSIHVETRTSFVEEDLSDEQAAILQKAFNCLGGK